MFQDEGGSKMKSLDSACRELVPDLPQFVTLLGKGCAVSERRAACGLPVCSVMSDSTLHSLTHVLPYLSGVLAEDQTVSRFFNIEDSTAKTSGSGNTILRVTNLKCFSFHLFTQVKFELDLNC